MKKFMDENFLLSTETAQKLFHETAEKLPIIDFHNHLDPKAIYENRCYHDLTEVWLSGDHYKWRAMRANGVPEELITGDGDPYEKFLAWADTIQNSIGNPLYHWTHLELQRYFGITTPLSPSTAKEIWDEAKEKLQTPAYSVQNLLRMQNVSVLCTTDDPIDTLEWHKKLAESKDTVGFSVCPSFRPGKILDIESPDFSTYVSHLSKVSGIGTLSLTGLCLALENRLDYFVANGCRVTDHSLEKDFFKFASLEEIEYIYKKAISGAPISENEGAKFRGFILVKLGKMYADRGLVMQLHIGAIRNNSTRMFNKLGADTGFDSETDFNYAPQLSQLLDKMDMKDNLPKIILYYLNPKDASMLATMAGNYQSNSQGIRGKVQLGSAWWFCDNKNGMEYQMDTLADIGLISTFVGMLTDSRSFLSFPRHEYFRRILCNKIGSWVENGEYPDDEEYLSKLVAGICHDNAEKFFNFG